MPKRYNAIPLAEKGFVPIDEITNPVRWYVTDVERPAWLSGPYDTMAEADAKAADWNDSARSGSDFVLINRRV